MIFDCLFNFTEVVFDKLAIFGAWNSRSQAQKPWSVNKPRKILATITCCFSPQFLLPNSFGVWNCDWAVFFYRIDVLILKIKF